MPFDGLVAKCIAEELDGALRGGRIEKAHQPERDEIHLVIRNAGASHRLLISASASAPRLHLTSSAKPNPPSAPMFCMILRKYLSGGKVTGVAAEGFERAVAIRVESSNEMGDVSAKTLIAEMMGKHSNIILLNGDGRIIDSLIHVDRELSSVREVMPAREYAPPPRQAGKLEPGAAATGEILTRLAALRDEQPMLRLDRAVLDSVMGFSPLLCRELCRRAGLPDGLPLALAGRGDLQALGGAMDRLLADALARRYAPCVIYAGGGGPAGIASTAAACGAAGEADAASRGGAGKGAGEAGETGGGGDKGGAASKGEAGAEAAAGRSGVSSAAGESGGAAAACGAAGKDDAASRGDTAGDGKTAGGDKGGATGNNGGAAQKPSDFYCFALSCAGTARPRGTMSAAMDEYYEAKALAAGLASKKAALAKVVGNNAGRCRKKLAIQQESMRESANRDTYRLYGELITANLHAIRSGAPSARLLNYRSDAPDDYADIALDEDLSPQANAQLYFRKYRKASSTWKNAEIQSGESQKELAYLESVQQALDMAESQNEIDEIRAELSAQKYLPQARAKGRKPAPAPESLPRLFTSADGLRIYVGKNNRQNDRLTLKTASSADIWLHARNMPGSHVIIKKERGDVPEATLFEAAALAAYFSRARWGENVSVDYTAAKNVKKPPGAKPGMVTYENFSTLAVNPRLPGDPR
jgi:predicted ribosome quality control (RQC) complex YloA/Tae2 family protein